MRSLKIATFVFLLVCGLLDTAALASPASVMLREGLYAEEVEGDIGGAMKIYEQIINDKSASRENVAQALYRQGMCCLKNRDDAGAKEAFGRLATEYADYTELVEKVRPYLADLTNHDPAGLMPPETLVYIELGSPGEQIETVLTMLKGTPFENPLAVMGGGNTAGAGGAWKSPADMIAAFMNPSMMAEFKKIKGMAMGVTDIKGNIPSSVVVLYPGKSDALRGLIMMGLNMMGTAGEPIQGMQTLSIPNAASVAYDDEVILMAQPAEQLQWCIKQYKGLIPQSSLASSNASFAKLDKRARRDNALTVWANVDEAYSKILKMQHNPQELLQANAICDFVGIDEGTLVFSVEPSGLNCKADILFKDGHQSLAYGMIRTPNISRGGLEAVPSDAIIVGSFALNQANGVQVDRVNTKIQNITGLDIGREIYANIEQVTVFVMPSGDGTASWNPFIPNFGLAIKSRNPQQTRQILAALLGTIQTMNDAHPSGQIDTNADRFLVDVDGSKETYCYIGQIDDTTVLSLNRKVIDVSIGAVKSKKNICTAGPLNEAVNKLPVTTSKLVLINAGGAMRLAGPTMNVGPLNEEQLAQLNKSIEQLASAADRMTVQIRTDEQINNFSLNAGVTGIPPLNEVIGPATQIANIFRQVEIEEEADRLRQGIAATIMQTPKPPVIDGREDDVWSAAVRYKIGNVLYTPLSSPDDLSASFRALWDSENFYILVDVNDDVLVNDTNPGQWITLPTGSTVSDAWWYDDCVEVYIDADNSKSAQYDDDDAQYHFDWDRNNPTMGMYEDHGRLENIEFAVLTTDKGYRTEIKLPWETLGITPSVGASIGGDIHINDDDDGGARDSKITCCDRQDNAWSTPRAFGNAELAGLVGWWKFDETEGSTAKDSSGSNHDGILNGDAKWAKGKIGGAVELDGDGDFVKIADKAAFDIGGQVTVSCWVNIRSVPHDYTAIVTKGDNSWRLSTAGRQRKFHTSVNDWNQLTVDGSMMVNTNEWHHVATVYNNKEVRLYVDGRLDASRPWEGGIAKNNFDVMIGENAQQSGRSFDGLIDDVRIYNYALEENDIMALYGEAAKE